MIYILNHHDEWRKEAGNALEEIPRYMYDDRVDGWGENPVFKYSLRVPGSESEMQLHVWLDSQW